ncbi:unnamed protein product [Adineta ricciae]|uniref:G-protein coupled receptors family 1 profile domain-containing protein n=1 Tax=Adineta ricciae TaxID=249248 RepID=A0A814PJV5_ADIRI|nr:unnamed protein product [Adineta ricciae]CAF1107011.1 unnamed protein product [Adineta ricciae]
MSLLSQESPSSSLQTRILNILCYILVCFGIIGNVLGLFIFSSSRRSWRVSSTYAFLATCSSITNLLCVFRYSAILHSSTRHRLHKLVGGYSTACKLYEFSFSFRVLSSWNTLFWMFERLMCISIRLRTLFAPCNSYQIKFILPLGMIIFILLCVIAPPLLMFEPQLSIHHTLSSNTTVVVCEVHPNASLRWQRYFQELHLGFNHFTVRCLFSELIPTGVIILFNSIIIHHLLRTNYHLSKRITHRADIKQFGARSWMNIVLVVHSFLFLFSLLSHIIGHIKASEAHESWWVLLAVLMNCSLNFYVYCLSGRAFRIEVGRLIRRCRQQYLYHQQIYQTRQRRRYESSFELNNV